MTNVLINYCSPFKNVKNSKIQYIGTYNSYRFNLSNKPLLSKIKLMHSKTKFDGLYFCVAWVVIRTETIRLYEEQLYSLRTNKIVKFIIKQIFVQFLRIIFETLCYILFVNGKQL